MVRCPAFSGKYSPLFSKILAEWLRKTSPKVFCRVGHNSVDQSIAEYRRV